MLNVKVTTSSCLMQMTVLACRTGSVLVNGTIGNAIVDSSGTGNVYLLGANTSVGVNLAGVSSVYLRNANGLSSTLACDHASHAQRPDLLTTKQKMILSCMQSASLLMCMGTCLLNLFDREDASAACLMLLQDDQQHLSAALSACVSVRRCLVVTYLPACLPIYSVHSEVHLCIVSNLNHSTWNSAVHVTWLSNWSQKVGLQHLRSF